MDENERRTIHPNGSSTAESRAGITIDPTQARHINWLMIGVTLTLVGSFLPWVQQGDAISLYIPGIQVLQRDGCGLSAVFEDHGGLLVVLLSFSAAWLRFRTPGRMGPARLGSLVASMVLVLLVLFHIGRVFVAHAAATYVGAPVVWMGLWVVLAGALLILLTTVRSYRRGLAGDDL